MNLSFTVLINSTPFIASKTRFLAFSMNFWTRILVYLQATNSGIALQLSDILIITFTTVMNFLFTFLLNKTSFTGSKTRLVEFLNDFWTLNLAYFKAINSGIL